MENVGLAHALITHPKGVHLGSRLENDTTLFHSTWIQLHRRVDVLGSMDPKRVDESTASLETLANHPRFKRNAFAMLLLANIPDSEIPKTNYCGHTTLFSAAAVGDVDMVWRLLQRGANFWVRGAPIVVWTPAVTRQDMRTQRQVFHNLYEATRDFESLSSGFGGNQKNAEESKKPHKMLQLAALLNEAMKRIEKNPKDACRWPVLTYAAELPAIPVLTKIIVRPDIVRNLQPSDLVTGLFWAASRKGRLSVLNELVESTWPLHVGYIVKRKESKTKKPPSKPRTAVLRLGQIPEADSDLSEWISVADLVLMAVAKVHAKYRLTQGKQDQAWWCALHWDGSGETAILLQELAARGVSLSEWTRAEIKACKSPSQMVHQAWDQGAASFKKGLVDILLSWMTPDPVNMIVAYDGRGLVKLEWISLGIDTISEPHLRPLCWKCLDAKWASIAHNCRDSWIRCLECKKLDIRTISSVGDQECLLCASCSHIFGKHDFLRTLSTLDRFEHAPYFSGVDDVPDLSVEHDD